NKSQVMTTLGYLTDMIGPRLTGSAAMKLANDWTEAQFKLYGLSASQEAWEYGVTWERGPISFQIDAPFRRNLTAHSWAWTAGTGGKTLTGPVALVDASTPESLAVYKDKIKGAWLMLRPAGEIWNPDGPPMTAADSAEAQAAREARMAAFRAGGRDTTEAGRQARRQFAVDRNYLLKQYGALGILTDASKEFGLMNMSGSPYSVSPLPNVVIAHEDYAQFGRLLEHGVTPKVSGRVDNTLGTKPVTQWNTIGEIKGTEWPDQVVILGAHLDSWDLGTGTTDNATGSAVVMEAARVIKASGLKPKRTMRFVLFSGEEEGLLGSAAYAAQHAAEADKIQAVLVLDNGTGMITGMALQGRNEDAQLWTDLLAPVAALGADKVREGNKGGTDHLSFIPYGVPGWNYDQESRGYNHTHHSQVDTYDHAVPSDLRQASAVMAVTAFELANLPVLLPRGPTREVTPRTITPPSPGLVTTK
ncbi:MAG: M20/M25/M40 family metallo-hydrolase, partial [Gemmatimonadota bacterium]|nr:M20/M25/M40 family metallo-hydrolase [Gemmatimonadota bacterium]